MKAKLCGNEQRNGRVLCNVLDCGGAVTLENESAIFLIQCRHHPFLRLSGCGGIAQRAGLGKVKGLARKRLWLQEVVRERELQIKSTASKANKADLGTKVLRVARLNALQGTCGIVVPGRISKDADENANGLYPD